MDDGENEGSHRDGNLNFLLPGQNQTMQLSLSNPGLEPMNVSLTPSELVPLAGQQMIWNSTDQGVNTTWDGHQSCVLIGPFHYTFMTMQIYRFQPQQH